MQNRIPSLVREFGLMTSKISSHALSHEKPKKSKNHRNEKERTCFFWKLASGVETLEKTQNLYAKVNKVIL